MSISSQTHSLHINQISSKLTKGIYLDIYMRALAKSSLNMKKLEMFFFFFNLQMNQKRKKKQCLAKEIILQKYRGMQYLHSLSR